jgi:hypothetical protein
VLAVPCIHVCRLVIPAGNAERCDDKEKRPSPIDPDVVGIAEVIQIAAIAEEVGVAKRILKRFGERPRIQRFLLLGQPRIDPIAQLVFG